MDQNGSMQQAVQQVIIKEYGEPTVDFARVENLNIGISV
jgi:hypothetical protein